METEERETETKESQKALSETMNLAQRKAWSNDVIKNHALGAVGIGLVPLPLVDFIALSGLQLKLIAKLSKFYGVAFSKDKGKKLIATLVGGSVPLAMARPAASLIKIIPVIGQTTGGLAMSAIAGASTYAVGKVFVAHFEAGGTLLDFDPEKLRKHFADEFKEGRKLAEELKKSTATPEAS